MSASILPAAGIGPAAFLAAWPMGVGQPDAARVATLIANVWGPEATAGDTLGLSNQRSLALHRALCGGRIEARVTCPHCAAENEAELPVADLLALPPPPEAVTVETDGGPTRFGLPRMAELAALASAGARGAVEMAGRLALDRPLTGELSPAQMESLAAAWEAADPVGVIALGLDCFSCGRQMTATVDPAVFVARDFDRLADRLMKEVDVIARAYGWSETDILALPAVRRRRYVAFAASGGPQHGRLS
jgi:hypothetical protein